MPVTPNERQIVRTLATQVAEIAALPIHETKRAMWRRLNGLKPVRPMVWINEEPDNELWGHGELALQCNDAHARDLEARLRWTLYTWTHYPVDSVIDSVLHVPITVDDDDFGITVKTVPSAESKGAAHYLPVVRTEADFDKIHTPEVIVDRVGDDRRNNAFHDLIGDILPIRPRGLVHRYSVPIDKLMEWCGIDELLTAIVDRPEFVHYGMSRLMDAMLGRLDRWEQMGLLDVTDGNYRIGSGGLGFTDELPGPNFDPSHVTPMNQWGMSIAQIFAAVSPAMHDEFSLQYELRWLERFGLNCYGCCEPLHHKVDILRKVPRLRRISMSPWIDIEKAVAAVGTDFVFSYKPNPAYLAGDRWNPDVVEKDLRRILDAAKGCRLELILKDIHTCRNEPHRIWEWCSLAMRLVEEYAPHYEK
jgi:hypothetical protein